LNTNPDDTRRPVDKKTIAITLTKNGNRVGSGVTDFNISISDECTEEKIKSYPY